MRGWCLYCAESLKLCWLMDRECLCLCGLWNVDGICFCPVTSTFCPII
uniref:Uncharacterized protein n=1 Tax=Arundo donax TaxID=35708 RepID=A0A0A8Z7V6_ARUDO